MPYGLPTLAPPDDEQNPAPPPPSVLSAFGQTAPALPPVSHGMDVSNGAPQPLAPTQDAPPPAPAQPHPDGKEAFHGQMRDFGQKDADLRGQIISLDPHAPDYLQKLGVLHTAQGVIKEEKASYEKQHPWGSPESSHPGVFGKVGHALGEIGNVAGAALAPEVAVNVPGSQMNLQREEQRGLGEEKFGADLAGGAEKAAATGETAGARKETADTNAVTAPIRAGAAATTAESRADTADRGMTLKENPPAGIHKPVNQQHVTDSAGNAANYHPDTGTYTHPDGSPFPNFKPAPSYAQTGNYQPTEVATPQGTMVPGTLNSRTGAVNIPKEGSNVAIPKNVQGEVNKELETARNADRRLAVMEHNLETALRGDQQAMVSLVANHIGMTLGAQKGARINQAVWNEAIASRPWLQGAEAKFDSRGLLTGVTLSLQQMQQMIDLAKEVRDTQWQQVDQTFGNYGIKFEHGQSTTDTPAPTEGGGRPSVAEWLKSQQKKQP